MKEHKHNKHDVAEPYLVMATLCEPDYDQEWLFLATERAFVHRKLAEEKPKAWGWLSAPQLGIYHRHDWHKYAQQLNAYARKLAEYSEDVQAGVLPVKFAVYNAAGHRDERIDVTVKVTDGRIDQAKKVPARPARLDGRSKPWKGPGLGFLRDFSRSNIKITPHTVGAIFSTLGPHDGAELINQVVHIHTAPDTAVRYELKSRKVPSQHGDVEIA